MRKYTMQYQTCTNKVSLTSTWSIYLSLSLVCIIIVTRQNDRAFDSLVTILGIFDKHFRWESILWQCQNTHTHTYSLMYAFMVGPRHTVLTWKWGVWLSTSIHGRLLVNKQIRVSESRMCVCPSCTCSIARLRQQIKIHKTVVHCSAC